MSRFHTKEREDAAYRSESVEVLCWNPASAWVQLGDSRQLTLSVYPSQHRFLRLKICGRNHIAVEDPGADRQRNPRVRWTGFALGLLYELPTPDSFRLRVNVLSCAPDDFTCSMISQIPAEDGRAPKRWPAAHRTPLRTHAEH